MKTTRNWISLAFLSASLLITIAVYMGALERYDDWMQDALFQGRQKHSGSIALIEINDRALEKLGPYSTWDRNIMASALEKLGEDPDNKPAVVAIDTLYTGESDPEADRRLVAAAEKLGNVITAATANIGVDMSNFNARTIRSFEESFPELKAVTTQGHINAEYDIDGIMRHAILNLKLEDGREVFSMAFEAARMYNSAHGKETGIPATDSYGRFYVDYTGLPEDFSEFISIYDLINGDVDPGAFAGKIVFIGPYAVGLQDSIYTSIDHGRQMYGVEYQANVVEMFLRGSFKQEVYDLPQALILFLICILCSALMYILRIWQSALVYAAFTAGSVIVSRLLYRGPGLVLHVLWIPFGLTVLFIMCIVVRYFLANRRRQEIIRVFSRYVDPEIVDEIFREGMENLSLGGKLCDIAVLFVDIRGFTSMSERLEPEKVVSILNEYLTMTSDCIAKNKGTLDKFVGDATMAFWGAPLPQEDSVYLAARTAVDIVNGAREVSERLKETIGEELNVGVGVNYGSAVVGNIGAARRMDFTAIGDTVNTAARLEANAPSGTIYISRSVADKLGDRIETTSLGSSIHLKGKADGFEILTLDNIL